MRKSEGVNPPLKISKATIFVERCLAHNGDIESEQSEHLTFGGKNGARIEGLYSKPDFLMQNGP